MQAVEVTTWIQLSIYAKMSGEQHDITVWQQHQQLRQTPSYEKKTKTVKHIKKLQSWNLKKIAHTDIYIDTVISNNSSSKECYTRHSKTHFQYK